MDPDRYPRGAFSKLFAEEEPIPQPPAPPAPVLASSQPFEIQVTPALDRLKNHLLTAYGSRYDEVSKEYEALGDVDSETKSKKAVSVIAKAKKLAREMEDERTKLTKPLLSFKGGVDSAFKSYSQNLGTIESNAKGKLGIYQSRVEIERLKAEKATREEAARIQAKLDEEAKAAGVEAPQVMVPTVAPQSTTTRTDEGTASVVKTWTFEVTDETQVPREYLMVDEKKIRQAVKGGVRQIAGIRIYEEANVRIRT